MKTEDKKFGKVIYQAIEEELDRITFDKVAMNKVMEKIKSKSLLRRILDYEIVIPINTAIAGIGIVLCLIGFLSYSTFSLTPELIEKSQIEYINMLEADKW